MKRKFKFCQDDEEKIESSHIESIDLKRRFTLITPSEPIPSDVDDEQPNEDEEEELEGEEENGMSIIGH